jgi:hypothetical protein
MGAIWSSETEVHTRYTQRHIAEDDILHSHRCENLKSYKAKHVIFDTPLRQFFSNHRDPVIRCQINSEQKKYAAWFKKLPDFWSTIHLLLQQSPKCTNTTHKLLSSAGTHIGVPADFSKVAHLLAHSMFGPWNQNLAPEHLEPCFSLGRGGGGSLPVKTSTVNVTPSQCKTGARRLWCCVKPRSYTSKGEICHYLRHRLHEPTFCQPNGL